MVPPAGGKKSTGMDRIELIRMKEKEYHDACYGNNELFQEGTWLKKPAKIIINELNRFRRYNTFSALDLGCGIGRHSIPIALTLKGRDGDVVCVDMLDSATVKLEEYGNAYDVSNYLTIIKSSIEEFSILEDGYNMIVAVSSLEHLRTKDFLKEKLYEMRKGTKTNGVNCIIVNTNIKEIYTHNHDQLDPMFEINIPTQEMLALLDFTYRDWQIEKREVKHKSYGIERNEKPVLVESDCVTYVAINPSTG
jgi:SAM-dependent methyltransferase